MLQCRIALVRLNCSQTMPRCFPFPVEDDVLSFSFPFPCHWGATVITPPIVTKVVFSLQAWYRRGRIQADLRNYENAIDDMKKVLSLESSVGGQKQVTREMADLEILMSEMTVMDEASHMIPAVDSRLLLIVWSFLPSKLVCLFALCVILRLWLCMCILLGLHLIFLTYVAVVIQPASSN